MFARGLTSCLQPRRLMRVRSPTVAAMSSSAPASGLVEYLNESPTAFHSVATSSKALKAAGFVELSERAAWSLAPGAKCFFVRGGSTLVAFAVGGRAGPGAGFVVVGAHTDSPCLKLKPVSKAGVKAWKS